MLVLTPTSGVRRPRKDAKITYNRYSYLYDFIGGQFERKYTKTGLTMLTVQPGEKVLEVGFGTGHAIVTLAHSVGTKGRVTGIDISEKMCAITRRRVYRAGLSDRVVIHCDDAIKMPFRSEQFDAIFMSFTLELFDTPDIPRLLIESKRVLKANGRIGVVTLSKSKSGTRIERLYEWIHRLFPQWVDCRPIYGNQILSKLGFEVLEEKVQPLFGLSVSMIIAIKPLE
jgi:ubiquinone/menaquinone biosynthesis C-methylase UbiE